MKAIEAVVVFQDVTVYLLSDERARRRTNSTAAERGKDAADDRAGCC